MKNNKDQQICLIEDENSDIEILPILKEQQSQSGFSSSQKKSSPQEKLFLSQNIQQPFSPFLPLQQQFSFIQPMPQQFNFLPFMQQSQQFPLKFDNFNLLKIQQNQMRQLNFCMKQPQNMFQQLPIPTKLLKRQINSEKIQTAQMSQSIIEICSDDDTEPTKMPQNGKFGQQQQNASKMNIENQLEENDQKNEQKQQKRKNKKKKIIQKKITKTRQSAPQSMLKGMKNPKNQKYRSLIINGNEKYYCNQCHCITKKKICTKCQIQLLRNLSEKEKEPQKLKRLNGKFQEEQQKQIENYVSSNQTTRQKQKLEKSIVVRAENYGKVLLGGNHQDPFISNRKNLKSQFDNILKNMNHQTFLGRILGNKVIDKEQHEKFKTLYNFIKVNINPCYLPTDLSNLLHAHKIKFDEIEEKVYNFELTIVSYIMQQAKAKSYKVLQLIQTDKRLTRLQIQQNSKKSINDI